MDVSSQTQSKQLILQLTECLAVYNKRIARIHTMNDVISVSANQPSESEVPVILVSSVTGLGIEMLKKLLFLLPPRLNLSERQRLEQVTFF